MHKNLEKTQVNTPEQNPDTPFTVNPEFYPTFSQQTEWKKIENGKESVNLNIEQTLGRVVSSIANTISVIAGESKTIPPIDHVIYLDKSARPVSWLVDEFWNEFVPDKEQPEKSFLAIDRKSWFITMFGIVVDNHGYIDDQKISFEMFRERFESPQFREQRKKYLAGIHALYVEGGVNTEDPDKILKMPTILDGKNILIVDEIEDSGTTKKIAEYIINKAINYERQETKSIHSCIFWQPGHLLQETYDEEHNLYLNGNQIRSLPAWYPQDVQDWRGRGIKDPDQSFYAEEYERNPNNITRARKLGAFALGIPLKDETEDDGKSAELREEIRQIYRDYKDGRILPIEYGTLQGFGQGAVKDRIKEFLKSKGVLFEKENINKPNSYLSIKSQVKKVLT